MLTRLSHNCNSWYRNKRCECKFARIDSLILQKSQDLGARKSFIQISSLHCFALGRLSQAAKGGLAAGLIFGFLIGILHLGTLAACSSSQLGYIHNRLATLGETNQSASTIFSFDLVYYPMVNGLTGFVLAEILAVGFGALYLKLPGRDSKRKGEVWAIPVYVVALIVGPAYIPYQCSPVFIPYLATIACFPAAVVFGYLLGVFYDAFGRLAVEQKEELEAARKKELEEKRSQMSENQSASAQPSRGG